MTFLTILGVTEILCSFKLVLEGKTGKEIPESSRLEFLEKFSANNFALTDAEDNTFWPLNRGNIIADLVLLRTLLAICQNSWEPSFQRWTPESQVMDSLVLLAYAHLAASRTLGQELLACPNFTLDSEDLFYWYKQKRWFQWTMAAAQTAENHGDEWGLTWYLRWRIYTSIPTWTHSKNSLAAAETKHIFQGNLSQMITKTVSIRIVISYAVKWGIQLWFWQKVNGNWDSNMIRISQWRESLNRTNISVRRKK